LNGIVIQQIKERKIIMILFIAKYAIVAVAGFVAGILVGRKNKTLVEKAVAEGKVVESTIAAKIEKK
jgi:hypothetical protein